MKADVRTIWRLLRPHARGHLLALLLVFLFGTLAALGERSVFVLLTPSFEALFGSGGSDAGETLANPSTFEGVQALRDRLMERLLGDTDAGTPEGKLQVLRSVAFLVVGIAIFSGIFQYLFTWLSRRIALLMVVDLRMRLARHLMSLSMRYHDSRKLGDVLSRISADVNSTLAVLNDAFRNLILEPLLAVASLVMAFLVAPLPTIAMLVGLPTVVIPVALLSKRVRKGSTRSLTKLGASVQVLTQMFQGIRTVKAFRAEERELENFRQINREYVSSSMKMVRAVAQTNLWTIVFTHGGLAALIVLVGWLQLNGYGGFAKAGDMIAFFVLIANVYTNIKKTTRMWTRLQESVGASQRLQELLDESSDLEELDGAHQLEGLGAGLRLESVSFSYPEGDGAALSDITLEIQPGETLALVGASGAGKSTLIDIIARFRDPTSGRIMADGYELRELSFDSWSAQYAMVGQTPFLFHATVEENISYGRPGASKEDIIAAARAADIHDFIEGLPDGYDTDVADMGSRLSGGQRQRITIARAILKGAPLLLLDEATSALDTATEVKVQAALDTLCEGRTVVVIAHRLSTIRGASRIAVMESGRIVELGTHDTLIEAGGAYARLYAAQFNTGQLAPG
jgi:ATP-binding cassette, subfamily B, bacterial MsbA